MSQQNQDAIFYPEKGKILINAQFYTFWISPEEFKKYNLEYLDNNNNNNNKLNNSTRSLMTAWGYLPAITLDKILENIKL